ncbi:unnamed protein product [Mycena citricolor]|uniref:FAD/NAD(P)-binding domain-containing protein n=1 Tax=Mycena citricolor TaxID=2018698 RepID=A0AAD2K810_9AGAR|nr:unnamed protein product [Mycena citricolor]CAK5281139.1 unnamed protein product [Mycena citricolor]
MKSNGRRLSTRHRSSSPRWTHHEQRSLHPIKTVAVIGAGPAGLQAASQLLEAGLSARMFDRAPSPGGTWFYTDEVPVPEGYPDASPPIDSVPDHLPATRFIQEGEDGLALDDRWREHWHPRPTITELPDLKYPPGTPWHASTHAVQRYVRAYASLHALNVNGNPAVTAYSTRVESIEKDNTTWALTLRKLDWHTDPASGTKLLREAYWTETFDAVVAATGGQGRAYVPSIPGIGEWGQVTVDGRHCVKHAQQFRFPVDYANKIVLIVGAMLSATEIARAIAPYTSRLFVSVRHNPFRDSLDLDLIKFPNSTEMVAEIASFQTIPSGSRGIKNGRIHLIDGRVLEGIDEIILATGYRRDMLLPDVNRDGWDAVYWTGHYVHDPTLVYTRYSPWLHGRYQSLAIAKVWTGRARIPSSEQMIQDIRDKKYFYGFTLTPLLYAALVRQYVSWLNTQSLEFGGQFVDQYPLESRESYAYFTDKFWKKDWISHADYAGFDQLPASEWHGAHAANEELGKLLRW